MRRHGAIKDLYLILNVSREATTAEIKLAYRKVALALHPDRHDGCEIKTNAFKQASEAYRILIDVNRRREYDLANGVTPSGWYNKNRRRPPPANYRKVYAPHAPPDGKWNDAQRHYDMHYGDGMFREAMKNAYNRAEAAGEFDYHSPLGKGFSFEKSEDRKASFEQNVYLRNPYSKANQGPPSHRYKYEESHISDAKTMIDRKEKVIQSLRERREGRINQEVMKAAPLNPGQRAYQPFNQQSVTSCQIM